MRSEPEQFCKSPGAESSPLVQSYTPYPLVREVWMALVVADRLFVFFHHDHGDGVIML